MSNWWIPVLLFVSFVLSAACRDRSRIGLGGIDIRKDVEWIETVPNSRKPYATGDYGRRLPRDGVARFYEIHVPPGYSPSKPTPVVLGFHGGGGYPSALAYQSGMDGVADREGFLVLYPAGTGKLFKDRLLVWNDGRRMKDGSPIGGDDVAFVRDVLDDAASLFNVDKSRIYACGISNGAQFCYRLAKQMSDRIAAIAVVAGHRPANYLFPPPPNPVSVMQFSGRSDPYAPYDGGVPSSGKGGFKNQFKTTYEPVESVMSTWVKAYHCGSRPAEVRRVGNAVMTRWEGPDGVEVVLWTLEDGGHTWPGGEVFPAEVRAGVGKVNTDISASELIWEFFERHRR